MSEKCHNGPTSEAAFEGRILKVFIHWNNSVRKRGSLQQSKTDEFDTTLCAGAQ